jgi:hypothetical protein
MAPEKKASALWRKRSCQYAAVIRPTFQCKVVMEAVGNVVHEFTRSITTAMAGRVAPRTPG